MFKAEHSHELCLTFSPALLLFPSGKKKSFRRVRKGNVTHLTQAVFSNTSLVTNENGQKKTYYYFKVDQNHPPTS